VIALPAVSISGKDRASAAHFLSEIIVTLGLIVVIFALARSGRARATPAQAAGVLVPHPPSRAPRDQGPGAGLPSRERPLA
jgi:glycerol uptake facilitator-like aquaporin